MPTSPTLGGLTSVLASAPPPSSTIGDLIPVIAVAFFVIGIVAVVTRAPSFDKNLKERRNDMRAFTGRAPEEPESASTDDDEPSPEREEVALWGTLDFSIYGDPPEAAGEAEPG